MLELLSMPTERVTFKVPREMSGPNVYRFSLEIQDSFTQEQQDMVLDFSEVDYIDLHGLVLLRDLCEMVSVCGGHTWAAQTPPAVRDLLLEVNMLKIPQDDPEGEYEMKSA